MFICYESVAGLTSTLSASSKEGPFVSQVRKYSDAITISEASIQVQGTYDGMTRNNYQIEVMELGTQVIPTAPTYRERNFGAGFIVRHASQALAINDGNTVVDVTSRLATPGSTHNLIVGEHIQTAGGSLCFAAEYRFNKIVVGVCFANTIGATISGYYWNGSAWATLGTISDGTAAGGLSLAEDGVISWTMPGPWDQDILFAGDDSKYWMHLTWTNGLTGTIGECKIINRPEVFTGYNIEQDFTFECQDIAAGASQAVFSLIGSVSGNLGNYECGVRHVIDGASIAFNIWENPEAPWYNVTRARATFQPFSNPEYMYLYSDPVLNAAFANRMVLYWATIGDTLTWPFQNGTWSGTYVMSQVEQFPDAGIFLILQHRDTSIPPNIEYLEMITRKADGTTGRTFEDVISMVNDGYRYDRIIPKNYSQTHYTGLKYIASTANFESYRPVAGCCSHNVFFMVNQGHMIRFKVSDGTTQDMSTDPNHDGEYRYFWSVSAGVTIYAMGHVPPRIFMYNMRDNTWTEGDTTGLDNVFVPETEFGVKPAMTYLLDNHKIIFCGQCNHADGRKLWLYDPVTDGASVITPELWPELHNELTGIGYHQPTGQVHCYRYKGGVSSPPPIYVNLGAGTTSAWLGNMVHPPVSGNPKQDPSCGRHLFTNCVEGVFVYPAEEMSMMYFDRDPWEPSSMSGGEVRVWDEIPDSTVNPDCYVYRINSVLNTNRRL